MANKYFSYRDTSEPLKVMICPADYNTFPYKTTTSSYAVAEARVCGLSYPDYIRMLMYTFPEDVTIVGKNSKYLTVYWRKGQALYNFVRYLNAKMELLVQAEKNFKQLEKEGSNEDN